MSLARFSSGLGQSSRRWRLISRSGSGVLPGAGGGAMVVIVLPRGGPTKRKRRRLIAYRGPRGAARFSDAAQRRARRTGGVCAALRVAKDLTAAKVSSARAAGARGAPIRRQRRGLDNTSVLHVSNYQTNECWRAERRAAWLFHSRETPTTRHGVGRQSAHESRRAWRESSGKPLALKLDDLTRTISNVVAGSSNCRPWRRWTNEAAAHSRPRSSNSARGIARSSP